jgi:hypothetical protein
MKPMKHRISRKSRLNRILELSIFLLPSELIGLITFDTILLSFLAWRNPAVICRRHTYHITKYFSEIAAVPKTDFRSDFINMAICKSQQLLGPFDPELL